MTRDYFATILTGLLLSGIGISIAYWLLPPGAFNIDPMCYESGFARRWDGGCNGWTNELARVHVWGDLLHWIAYCTMAYVIIRRHPIIKNDWVSFITVYLTGAFILGCGFTHLFDAYSTLDPAYVFQGWFKVCNGIVSISAEFFVVYGLLRAVKIARDRERRLKNVRKL